MSDSRIRVLMVVGSYYPELSGGSLQCRTLIHALRPEVDAAVLTTTTNPGQPFESEVEGVTVYRVFVDPRSWRSKFAATGQLLALVRRLLGRYDVLHFHGFTEKMLPLVAAARLLRLPTVDKLTSVGWDDPLAIRSRRLGLLLARGLGAVDRLVMISPAMRDRCRRAGIADERLVDIPNGVDIDRFRPASPDERRSLRERIGLPSGARLVAFVGFWSEEKGPHRLFDAWLSARERTGVDTGIVYVGPTDASHPEVDRRLIESVRQRTRTLGLDDRVRFIDRSDDVAALLRASDIFALPSTREGLSNAVLEAMASGLPVVCAAIAGVTDSVIEHGVNGLIVPGEAAALERALATLLVDRAEAERLGCRARQTIVERFAIDQVADRYRALYRDLVPSS